MSEQELAVALGELRVEVAKNNEATNRGFATLGQQVGALTRAYQDQNGHCRACEAQLKAEISASEQRALARENALADRLNRVFERVDTRLRSLEVSRGWLTGLIALGSGLLGGLLPLAIQWMKG